MGLGDVIQLPTGFVGRWEDEVSRRVSGRLAEQLWVGGQMRGRLGCEGFLAGRRQHGSQLQCLGTGAPRLVPDAAGLHKHAIPQHSEWGPARSWGHQPLQPRGAASGVLGGWKGPGDG